MEEFRKRNGPGRRPNTVEDSGERRPGVEWETDLTSSQPTERRTHRSEVLFYDTKLSRHHTLVSNVRWRRVSRQITLLLLFRHRDFETPLCLLINLFPHNIKDTVHRICVSTHSREPTTTVIRTLVDLSP